MDPKADWRVASVEARDRFRLHVRFMDGLDGEVDMTGLLTSTNPGVFAPLLDPAVFAKVYVHLGAVTWPGELDLAPDAMYDDIKSTGVFLVDARG